MLWFALALGVVCEWADKFAISDYGETDVDYHKKENQYYSYFLLDDCINFYGSFGMIYLMDGEDFVAEMYVSPSCDGDPFVYFTKDLGRTSLEQGDLVSGFLGGKVVSTDPQYIKTVAVDNWCSILSFDDVDKCESNDYANVAKADINRFDCSSLEECTVKEEYEVEAEMEYFNGQDGHDENFDIPYEIVERGERGFNLSEFSREYPVNLESCVDDYFESFTWLEDCDEANPFFPVGRLYRGPDEIPNDLSDIGNGFLLAYDIKTYYFPKGSKELVGVDAGEEVTYCQALVYDEDAEAASLAQCDKDLLEECNFDKCDYFYGNSDTSEFDGLSFKVGSENTGCLDLEPENVLKVHYNYDELYLGHDIEKAYVIEIVPTLDKSCTWTQEYGGLYLSLRCDLNATENGLYRVIQDTHSSAGCDEDDVTDTNVVVGEYCVLDSPIDPVPDMRCEDDDDDDGGFEDGARGLMVNLFLTVLHLF